MDIRIARSLAVCFAEQFVSTINQEPEVQKTLKEIAKEEAKFGPDAEMLTIKTALEASLANSATVQATLTAGLEALKEEHPTLTDGFDAKGNNATILAGVLQLKESLTDGP